MKKLISAVTSLCVAATMVSAVAPISSGAADTKGFAIKTFGGASSTIDCSAGDVTVPCAIYLSEGTANTSAVAVAASFTEGPEVAKVEITNVIDFSQAYYSSEQTFTKADGSEFTTDLIPAWCGAFSRRGVYQGAGGGYNALTVASKMDALGAKYAYVAGGWLNSDGEYEYTGATSDAYPFLVFEVKFPQGIAAGDYTIEFVNTGSDADHPENKATMIEADTKYTKENGNLSLTPLTITVSGEGQQSQTTTSAATTTTATTTTKAATSQDTSDADIVIDLGSYTVPSGGGDVEMNITMDPKGNYLTSVSAFMKADAGLEYDGMEKKSEAFGSAITINDNDLKFNFATLKGSDAMTCDAGDTIATVYWIVPETTADGTYYVSFDKFEVMNGTEVYKVAVINGDITVGDGGETTTSATTTSTGTTTTTSSTTTTTATTTTATTTSHVEGTPFYGDSNCDGKVNVADVVVLNKWRNDNTSYDLTAQGKINADCFNAGGEITEEDSIAILQSIVHLVTLPATALAE